MLLSLQRGLQVPLPQQEPAGLQHTPPAGATQPLRRRPPVGERHRDVHAVGRRLGSHRLEGLPQEPEGGGATGRRALGLLQGRTLANQRPLGREGRQVEETSPEDVLRRENRTGFCSRTGCLWRTIQTLIHFIKTF